MRSRLDFDGLDGVLDKHGGEFDDDEITLVADTPLIPPVSADAPTPREPPVRARTPAPAPVAAPVAAAPGDDEEPEPRRGLPMGLILGGVALAAVALIAVIAVVALGIGGATVASRTASNQAEDDGVAEVTPTVDPEPSARPESPAQPEVVAEPVAPQPEVVAEPVAQPEVVAEPPARPEPVSSSPETLPIAFGRDGYDLSGMDTTAAATFASGAKSCRGRVVVTGHTDDRGTDDVNDLIGLARAESVQSWLVAQGVPSARIDIGSAGSADPLASNGTEEGRRANRRVTITCTQ